MTTPDLRTALLDRYMHTQVMRASPRAQQVEREMCRRSFPRFCDKWCWTYDPRLSKPGKPAFVPFILFPRQLDMARWFDYLLAVGEDGVLAKSRDVGFTWVFAAWALHRWLFVPGHKTGFGSRKQEYVDNIGDPDAFFERVRMNLYRLPPWFLPDGLVPRVHDKFMLLLNPANGNTIRGEVGDDIGRGGRSSVYMIDEAAHLERPEKVEASTSATTNVRIWGSSANGPANLFARKWVSPEIPATRKFRFHWSDDPRKDETWARSRRASLEEHVWASEYDIDFSASVEGLFVPSRWVEAARRLRRLLAAAGNPVTRSARGVGGLDVGGGKAKSVFVARHGPLIARPVAWGAPDTIETAQNGLDEAVAHSCQLLNYDVVGIGAGVSAWMDRANRRGMAIQGINVGVPASEDRWPSGQTARELFANMKGELWGKARERFHLSWQLVEHLEGRVPVSRDGAAMPRPDVRDCAVFADDHPETQVLAAQISLPKRLRNEAGKLACEGKDALARRSVPSPDYAEALVLTFAEDNTVDVFRRAYGG